MTREDIIRMAEEAGFKGWSNSGHQALERFAALVAAAAIEQERKEFADHSVEFARIAVEKAISSEREACAKVCESHIDGTPDYNQAAWNCAEAIRTR